MCDTKQVPERGYKLLGATIKNIVAIATPHPGFVYPWNMKYRVENKNVNEAAFCDVITANVIMFVMT